ncbi:MAG TPA: Mth938-like domain-containing protein [Ramlibacter sp.]|nr:Mth938-like domain-containing protein [Ramlibacter sp.]
MKLQPDSFDVQAISGYGPGWVGVNGEKITHSVIVASTGERIDWNASSFEDLGEAHFARLAGLQVEVALFGSGSRIRFPKPAWLKPLIDMHVGLETMDTAAACRTYNILAQEGRRVAVALLIEPQQRD